MDRHSPGRRWPGRRNMGRHPPERRSTRRRSPGHRWPGRPDRRRHLPTPDRSLAERTPAPAAERQLSVSARSPQAQRAPEQRASGRRASGRQMQGQQSRGRARPGPAAGRPECRCHPAAARRSGQSARHPPGRDRSPAYRSASARSQHRMLPTSGERRCLPKPAVTCEHDQQEGVQGSQRRARPPRDGAVARADARRQAGAWPGWAVTKWGRRPRPGRRGLSGRRTRLPRRRGRPGPP